MPSAAALQRVAERYKPSLADRMKQSREARRNRLHAVPTPPPPPPVRRRDDRPTGGFFGSNGVLTIDTSSATVVTAQTNIDARGRVQIYRAHRLNTWADTMTTAATTDSNTIWRLWNDVELSSATLTTATTDSNTELWGHWCEGTGSNARNLITWCQWQEMEQPVYQRFQITETQEQKRLRHQQEQQYRREQAAAEQRRLEEAAKAKKAEDTALDLLRSVLSDEQNNDLARHGYFLVEAPSGRLYRIDKGTHGNVKVIHRQTRKIIERLCIQPNGVPAGDAMLMQKLLIETAEDAFRSHANITLEDGKLVYGDSSPLDGDKLAKIIPIRRAA